MNLYVVMINDRHTDTDAEVFATPGAAIAFARKTATELAHDLEDISEADIPGWLLYLKYGPEDSIWVLEKELRVEVRSNQDL